VTNLQVITATCVRCRSEFCYETSPPGGSFQITRHLCDECDAAVTVERDAQDAAEALQRAREERNVPRRYWRATFDNFDAVTLGQKDALKCCRDEALNGVFLYGPPGCGKTHLAAASILAGPAGSLFVGTTELINDIKAGFDRGGRRLLERAHNAPLLAIDDLGVEAVTDFVRDRMYDLLNFRWNTGGPIVVTTNCSPGEIGGRIGEGARSRLVGLCASRVDVRGTDRRKSASARIPGLEE
jgi:DNA replication protein DnaC